MTPNGFCPQHDTDAPGALCECPQPLTVEQAEHLRGRLNKLEHIVRSARHELRMPTDPDCEHCQGEGIRRTSSGMEWACDCKDVYATAMAFAREDVRRRAEYEAQFQAEHGHARSAGCTPACPSLELPF